MTHTDRRAGRDLAWSQGLAKAREIRLAKRRLAATLLPRKSSNHMLPIIILKKTQKPEDRGERDRGNSTRNKTKAEINRQVHPEIIHVIP